MRVFAKPRVKRETVATIAMLLACTCLACYLLAPLSRTLTNWLPFAATIYGDPAAPAAGRGATLSLAVGNPAADPRARSTPAPARMPASSAPLPVAVTASAPSGGQHSLTPTRASTSKSPVPPLGSTPSTPLPPLASSASSKPSSTPTPTPTPSKPTSTPTKAPPMSPSTSPPAVGHFVNAPAPRDFAGRPTGPALLAQAQTCASRRTGCAGLQEVGPSPNCVYPAWVLATPANIVVGYAMWQVAPGNCYYAIGMAIPPK